MLVTTHSIISSYLKKNKQDLKVGEPNYVLLIIIL